MSAISTDSHTLTATHINNPRTLLMVRGLWLVLLITVLGSFLISLPNYFLVLRDSPYWGGGYAEVLNRLHISRGAFAAYFLIMETTTVAIQSVIAILVFSRRSEDWMALLVSLMGVFMGVGTVLAVHQLSLALGSLILIGAVLLLYSTLLLFPDGTFQPARSKYTLIIVVPLALFASVLQSAMLGGRLQGVQTFIIANTFFSLFYVGLLSQIYRYQRILTPVQRQQTKWIVLGFAWWLTAMTLYVGIQAFFPALRYPAMFHQSTIYELHSFLAMFILVPLIVISVNLVPASFMLSIVRYRLWNIDFAVNRTLVYTGQTIMALLVFGLSFFLFQLLLRAVLGMEQEAAAAAIAAVVAAGLANTMRRHARRVVDRYLFGLRFDLDELRAAHQHRQITNPGALTGKVLDSYEVLDVIGKGGMGEVYKGVRDNETVAIKTMLLEIAQDMDMRERFHREAEIGMVLHHPHIVKVFASGDIDGMPYMVMEYVTGQDLRDYLKAGDKLDEETATNIMHNICAALDTAHQKGYVHRDLKPANIMIKANGEAVLMDFGVTKMADATSSLTGTGAIGTIDYMAPEQIMSSREVDRRADIYALGVMLYEVMTGEKPFSGSPAQVMFAHLQQPPPDPRDVHEAIPRPIAKAIMQAMSKKPEDRFQSAGEFAAALKG
jgi:predicted Ser/Thr protein kinase